MEPVVAMGVFCLVLLIIGVCLVCKADDSEDKFVGGLVLFIASLALLAIVTFEAVPNEMPSGLPMTSLDSGASYKVAFVYVAGENVNVGVEKKTAIPNAFFSISFKNPLSTAPF